MCGINQIQPKILKRGIGVKSGRIDITQAKKLSNEEKEG